MSLDRETIARAALDLLDREGIEGLSTRRLADQLGVKGPSLYWHFKNKAELLSYMSGVMFAQALPPPNLEGSDFNWVDWLASGARGIRRVALSRRDGAIVMARSRPVGVAAPSLAMADMTKSLQRSGLTEADSRMAMLCLGRFAIGWVLYEQAAAPRETLHGGDDGFEFGLATFIEGLKRKIG